jgi:hypothetical protein
MSAFTIAPPAGDPNVIVFDVGSLHRPYVIIPDQYPLLPPHHSSAKLGDASNYFETEDKKIENIERIDGAYQIISTNQTGIYHTQQRTAESFNYLLAVSPQSFGVGANARNEDNTSIAPSSHLSKARLVEQQNTVSNNVLIEMHRNDSVITVLENKMETARNHRKRIEEEESKRITEQLVEIEREIQDALRNVKIQLDIVSNSPISANSKTILKSTSIAELDNRYAIVEKNRQTATTFMYDNARYGDDANKIGVNVDAINNEYEENKALLKDYKEWLLTGQNALTLNHLDTGEKQLQTLSQQRAYFDARYYTARSANNNHPIDAARGQGEFIGSIKQRIEVIRAYRAVDYYTNLAAVHLTTKELLKQKLLRITKIVDHKLNAAKNAHDTVPSKKLFDNAVTQVIGGAGEGRKSGLRSFETPSQLQTARLEEQFNEAHDSAKKAEKRKIAVDKFNQTQLNLSIGSYQLADKNSSDRGSYYWSAQRTLVPTKSPLLVGDANVFNADTYEPDSNPRMIDSEWVDTNQDGDGIKYYSNSAQRRRLYTEGTTNNNEAETRRRSALELAVKFHI